MKNLIIFLIFCISLFAKEPDFKISYDPDYAPFSYNKNGHEAGLYVDIWKLWARYNNYTIEFVNGQAWENALKMAKNKEVDFFLGTNPYDDWMKSSLYFYEVKSSFFGLSKNNNQTLSKKDLKIGLIGKSYYDLITKNFPEAKIILFDEYKESIDALINEKIDLIYDDKTAVEYYTVQNNIFHLIKPSNKYIIKTKTNAISASDENIEIFNKGFFKIPLNELLTLEKKWILNEDEQYYRNFKQTITLTKEEEDFIKNNKIKVSVSNSWEPFTFKSKNEDAIGISSEYWNLIAKKLNLNTQNTFYETFKQQLESINKKEMDIIYSAGETPQRKEYAIFSKEYAKFPISIVTKKDENFIENISVIKNKKIAIGNNFTAHNILKNEYPELNFILVDSIKEGLELVSQNKAYAFIDIQPVLFYNIAKYNFNDLKVTGNTGLTFSLKFMIRNDYEILESILNKAIFSVSLEELNEIISKWNNVQFQTNIDYTIFWELSAGVLLIILAFLYRNYTLKNLNKTLKIKVEEKTRKLNELNKNLEEMVEKKTKELIQKENILNHQSKMAAMGEMLENIAHQWRQPLSLISTAATGAKINKDFGNFSDSDFYETMDLINHSAQHLSNTIDDFRNFFNNDKNISNFNINEPIEKVLYLISSKLKNRDIQVIKNTQDIQVTGLINEFIQVIINIINNSMDAFEEVNLEKKFIFIDLYKNNNSLILKIKDNAGGIKEDIINRIFEPYFTTKHKSQGTGIGLYMSMEIIQKHMDGKISVSNEEFIYEDIKYKGAQFKIELPIKD
jgi:signal transduction histidine kinase